MPIGDKYKDTAQTEKHSGAVGVNGFKKIEGSLAGWKQILPWCVVLLWMVVIFLFSTDNMDESAKKSNILFAFIETLFFEDGTAPQAWEPLRFFVRKAGHLAEFFVLGCLTANAWFVRLRHCADRWSFWQPFWRSAVFCAFYAATDELHQFFVPGRVASPVDVAIDTVGAILGIVILIGIRSRLQKRSPNGQ